MSTMDYGFQREQEMIQKVSKRAFEDGITHEKERIIKLVQDEYALVAKRNGYQFLPEQIDWLVALIKGEK